MYPRRGTAQTSGHHLLQAQVTGGVSEAVIDLLEAIQIHIQDRRLVGRSGRPGPGFAAGDLPAEAIWQTSQQVMVRLVNQLLVQLLPIRDVLHQNETAFPPETR